jgi:predicted transcriptional regulator
MSKNKTQTSLEAYASLGPDKINETYRRILWALTQIEEGTFENIATALNEKESRIWKRLSEMARMDLIYRTENKRELSSGRMGYTWKATLKGSPTISDHSRKISKIANTVKQLNLL